MGTFVSYFQNFRFINNISQIQIISCFDNSIIKYVQLQRTIFFQKSFFSKFVMKNLNGRPVRKFSQKLNHKSLDRKSLDPKSENSEKLYYLLHSNLYNILLNFIDIKYHFNATELKYFIIYVLLIITIVGKIIVNLLFSETSMRNV